MDLSTTRSLLLITTGEWTFVRFRGFLLLFAYYGKHFVHISQCGCRLINGYSVPVGVFKATSFTQLLDLEVNEWFSDLNSVLEDSYV